jgi:L-histidine N-alpha-methyltransferase
MSAVVVDVHIHPEDRRRQLLADVRRGLTAEQRSIPPVWFYDERGSRLFDEITRLPEYYLTRTERRLLAEHGSEIAKLADADTLVEVGSGTSEKTTLLIEAMQAHAGLESFVPFDVSEEVLREAARDIAARHGVAVHAVVGDFHQHLRHLPTRGRRLIAFLGSTVGNFDPATRAGFYTQLRSVLGPGDSFLLGVDLVKDENRLLAAYDDAAGVTARFNRNVLSVLATELDASFDPERFDHVARWRPDQRWIEMRLRARVAHRVEVRALGLELDFRAGDDILTEISTKFRPAQVLAELAEVGLGPLGTWSDPLGDYLLVLVGPR